MASTVTVYTTHPCPWCERVKQLLSSRGVEFQEINLAKDPDGRAELVRRTGMMTFPQVLVGDRLVGGFEQTLEAVRSGRFTRLLDEAQAA
jgi:glutaredoxin 3